MIISIDAKKVFEKIQHLFTIKTFKQLGIEINFLNLIKSIYKPPTFNIRLSGERLKAFPQDQNKARMSSIQNDTEDSSQDN